MPHRPARVIVALLVVTLLATTFGSAAEGKRPRHDASVTTSGTVERAATRTEWCANQANAGVLAATARALGTDTSDERWLEVLDAAATRATSGYEARWRGSQYASLRHVWDDWDRVCREAHRASN